MDAERSGRVGVGTAETGHQHELSTVNLAIIEIDAVEADRDRTGRGTRGWVEAVEKNLLDRGANDITAA